MSRRLAAAAGAVARRAPARFVAASVDAFGPVYGEFERDDGTRVPLLGRYRDAIKEWRPYWWPVRVLAGLSRRVELPPDASAVLAEVMRSRTLPMPPRELAVLAGELVERFPEHLVRLGDDGHVELVPLEADLDRLVGRYAASAGGVVDVARAHGLAVEGTRVLEVGTGSGRLAFALAGMGADEVVGVDLEPEAGVPSLEREPVRERLAGRGRVRLERGDVARLPFEDASFDFVCSVSAIEHFTDLPAALDEIHRVLRPGGLTYHGVDPWFGKGGGHSLCTLDFPWGHLRLTPAETERYLAEQRPFERDEAIAFHRDGFQVPRRTLAESHAAFEQAGLHVLGWTVTPLRVRDPHRRVVATALRDCRRLRSAVTGHDLLALAYGVVGEARQLA